MEDIFENIEDIFENVVKDEHMYDIAMAIRELLGPDDGMTILDFPQKIRDIKAQVLDVVNDLVGALCWRGTCEGVPIGTIIDALTWRE